MLPKGNFEQLINDIAKNKNEFLSFRGLSNHCHNYANLKNFGKPLVGAEF